MTQLELYQEKQAALKEAIEKEVNPIKRVDLSIELFYVDDTIENMIVITEQEANNRIDKRTKKYNRIISLLELKVALLNDKLATITDRLEKVNTQLEIFALESEIAAKKSFIAAWVERKKVL